MNGEHIDRLDILAWDTVKIGGLLNCEARVIWVSPHRDALALMRLDEVSWPELVSYAHAEMMISDGAWQHVQGMPPVYPPLASLTRSQLEKRNANWKLIQHLFEENVPRVFVKKERAQLIRQIVEDADISGNRVSRRHVENIVRKAMRKCMNKDALRPWEKCGKGIRRPIEELAKLGRKPAPGHPDGVNIDTDMQRFFALALRRFWQKNKKLDLRGAYDVCMRTFFMDVAGDLMKGGTHVAKSKYAERGLPTYEQFRYWAPKVVDLSALGRKKIKARVFDQKHKSNLGTSLNMTWGPGGRFQIDATVLDVYIRSRANSRVLIGRPVLYIVIDTFSRMICGIYLGLENPSWVAAMMAIANCSENKVEYCRKHGIEIDEEDWPCRSIPAVILGDKGEMERQFADHMIDLANITIENAAPYRGDWKGIVESCFRTIPTVFKPYIPGYIETDFKVRGTRDYRADAVFDLEELQQLFIHLVLHHNNDLEISGYPRHQKMDEDDVPSVPRELWTWGIPRLSGIPRQPDHRRFCFGLMPQAKAVVTDAGIVFEGRFYSCPTAVKRGWFSKAKLSGTYGNTISYDKRRTKEIMVHVPGNPGFEVAYRIDKGVAEDLDYTGWEEEGRRRQTSSRKANRRDQETIARANIDGKMETMASAAALNSEDAVAQPVSQQVAHIMENRAKDLAAERRVEADAFASALGSTSIGDEDALPHDSTVVSLPGAFTIPDFASNMDFGDHEDE